MQKICFLFETRTDHTFFGCMWRTRVPLWPDGARKALPGRLGTRPGVPRERPGGAHKSYSLLANGRTPKITQNKKNMFFKKSKNYVIGTHRRCTPGEPCSVPREA